MKKQRGITLVALVVTIVILIILASISINVVFGENGIIKLAQDAKKQTEDVITREETELNTLMAEYANIMAGGGEVVLVEQVTVVPTSLELTEGDTASLTAKVMPENAIKKEVTWSSSNEQIATVTNGIVTAKKAGEVTITATSTDGSKKQGICRITVKSKFSILPPDQITPEYLEELGKVGHQEGDTWIFDEHMALKIGDEIPIMLTNGKQIIAQVAGFNHDDLSNGSGKAPFTFITKEYVSYERMNSSRSNEGGWEASEMRKYTNGTLYYQFPAGWQAVIKTVNKLGHTVYNSGNSLTAIPDKIWIPSETEVFGVYHFSIGSEGAEYPLLRTIDFGGGLWLRSPGRYGTNIFCCTSYNSDMNTENADELQGIKIGFCI